MLKDAAAALDDDDDTRRDSGDDDDNSDTGDQPKDIRKVILLEHLKADSTTVGWNWTNWDLDYRLIDCALNLNTVHIELNQMQ